MTFAEAKGERSATFAGWLVRQNVDAYIVAVKKGETLQARIEGFRGHDATLHAYPLSAGTRPSSVQAPPDTGRTTSVTSPGDDEYRVDVVHIAPFCGPPQRYKLTITIR